MSLSLELTSSAAWESGCQNRLREGTMKDTNQEEGTNTRKDYVRW